MSVVALPRGEALRAYGRVVCATVRAFTLRWASSPTMLVRAPITAMLIVVGFALTYQVAGVHQVGGQNVYGFLLTGMVGTLAWEATIWGSGSALQMEQYNGTIGTTMIAPAGISPVIVGYGLGNLLFGLPGFVGCVLVGVGFGARFDIHSVPAAAVGVIAVLVATLCIGMCFGGLFILSRQSNALSNFLQAPIWLLAGFYVPRSALPPWLQVVSDAVPLGHAIDALRDATLSGQSLAGVWRPLAATAASALPFLLVGMWSLRRLDTVVRRRATLDLL